MNPLLSLQTQLRLAYHSLRHAQGFAASVVTTMSLTLAIVLVVFALVNTYFFKPLNVVDESRLYVVEQEVETTAGVQSGFQSYKAIVHWYKTQRSFERLTPVNPGELVITNLPGEPKLVATFTMPDYFELLRVPLALGQKFAADTPMEQDLDQVIISEKLWQQYYDRDPSVIGKRLSDGERAFTIIGVVAAQFEQPYMFYSGQTDIWLHFGTDTRFFNEGAWDNPWDNTYRSLKLLGTGKAGMSPDQIYQDLDAAIESIRAEWLEGYPTSTDFRPLLIPYRTAELGDKGHLSLFLLAGTLGLLLIALVNVSNLFFSRALAQHRNLALQAVLGAKRRLLFFAILSQTLLLMTASVAIALFLSAWGIRLFKSLAAGKLPLVQSIGIDLNLLLVAIGLCLVLAWLFALVTSRLVDFQNLRGQLQSSGKGSVNQVSGRTLGLLIGLQMALASTLIIFACLALSKTHQTLNRPLGSKIANLYAVIAFIRDENDTLTIGERYDKHLKIQAMLAGQPQFLRVSRGRSPVSLAITRSVLTDMQGKQTPYIPQAWVGPDYFEHTGLKILKGRSFSEEAIRGEKFEILVTRSLAFQLDPEGDVLGRVYDGLDNKHEIVGITEDFNHPNYYDQDKGAHIWWPERPNAYGFTIETHQGQSLSRENILALLREQDPRFNIWAFRSLEQEYAKIVYMDKITLYLSYLLAGFTLLLASVGIYGVLSYNLGLRRFEFGLRMALGAKKSRLYSMLIATALVPLAAGLCFALALTSLVYRLYAGALSPWLSVDIRLAVAAVLVTLAVALWASFRPMQRLVKGQPMQALRSE
jgi:macrolide transport system ATP-binding/permease protein